MATVDIELANWALDEAKRKGASAAEVLCVTAESLEAGVRMGEVEKLKSSRERRLGLRVFCGQSSATSSTAELERDSLGAFVASTVELARLSAADPWAGLPDPALHPKSFPELSLADPDSGIVPADRALEIARTGEMAGRSKAAASSNGTWPASVSEAWRPQRMRSMAGSLRIAAASKVAICALSAASPFGPMIWMARSAPMPSARRRALLQASSPTLSTVTDPPCLSLSAIAASTALAS